MTAPLLPVDVQMREDAALGGALRRVMASMPEGWTFHELNQWDPRPFHDFAPQWEATASHRLSADPEWEFLRGGLQATAVAALTALAEALEARKAAAE